MRGDQSVIDTLDRLISAELGARDQWFLYSRIVENWGLHKLAVKLMDESAEEAGHAKALTDRMVFLEATPSMVSTPPQKDETLQTQFEHSLRLELQAVADYRAAIQLCSTVDPTTRRLCELHLQAEEDHVNWLEEQMYLLGKMGIGLYMQTQI